MKHIRKSLVCLLLVLLLAAAALTGCTQNETNSTAAKTESQAQTEAPKTEAQTEAPKTEAQTEAPKTEAQTQAPETTAAGTPAEVERQELGEGAKLFYFDVTFSNGETSSYAIHTDAENVGDALVALDLIAGDEGQLVRADLLDAVPDDTQDSLSVLDEVELIFPMRVKRKQEL